MSYLIYVNGLGPDYKGDNLYEFIFSQDLELGENFEAGLPKSKIDQSFVELKSVKKTKKCQSKKLI